MHNFICRPKKRSTVEPFSRISKKQKPSLIDTSLKVAPLRESRSCYFSPNIIPTLDRAEHAASGALKVNELALFPQPKAHYRRTLIRGLVRSGNLGLIRCAFSRLQPQLCTVSEHLGYPLPDPESDRLTNRQCFHQILGQALLSHSIFLTMWPTPPLN